MFTQRGYVQLNKTDESLHANDTSINPMVDLEMAQVKENADLSIKVLYKERTYEITGLQNETTISELKARIQGVTEVLSSRQRLILSGKLLKPDEKTLSYFKITSNTTIHLFPIPEASVVPPPVMSVNALPASNHLSTYHPLFNPNDVAAVGSNDPSTSTATLRGMYYNMALEQTAREVRLWCFVLVSLSAMELLLNFNYLSATGKIGNGALDSVLFVLDTVCSIGGIWVGSMGMKSLRTMDIEDVRKYVQWLGVLALGCIILRIIWVADVIVQVKEAVRESKKNETNGSSSDNQSNLTDDQNRQPLDDRVVVTFGVQAFIVASICIGAWISCFRRALRLHMAVSGQQVVAAEAQQTTDQANPLQATAVASV